MKPRDYHERRRWQDDARARGEVPECAAWVNSGTPLLYCGGCARLINRYNALGTVLCSPEVTP